MKRYISSAINPYWNEPIEVLRRIARDPNTRLDILKSLADHPDHLVQYYVSKNPAATEWFKQHPKLWKFHIEELEYGIDVYYANSAYDGTNPEVIIDLMKQTIEDYGYEFIDCYVSNLPDDAWEEGENCAFIGIKYTAPDSYGEITDLMEAALVEIGCEIISCDYY